MEEDKVTKKVKTFNFTELKTLDEIDMTKKFMQEREHRLSFAGDIFHKIQDAIHLLNRKHWDNGEIRITTNKVFFDILASYQQEMYFGRGNYIPKSIEIMGVKVNTEHPYMEIVVHHVDSAIYPELLVKIDIEYYKQ